jgi:translation initiation factor IF-2
LILILRRLLLFSASYQPRSSAYRCRKSGSTESKNFDRKASLKRFRKVVVDKKEVKAVIETKEPVKEPKEEKEAVVSEEKSSPKAEETPEEAITTQYQKLSELN